jgi:hypothetical protein
MNTFDVKKRCILSFDDFLKDRKKAEDADHSEKGENDIVKKSMAGEKEGAKGYATLGESELFEGDLFEREFSTKQREKLAAKGFALPDGSFPIASKADLERAIKAHGRASDITKAKAHIKKRAKALGQTGLIPKEWK